MPTRVYLWDAPTVGRKKYKIEGFIQAEAMFRILKNPIMKENYSIFFFYHEIFYGNKTKLNIFLCWDKLYIQTS